MDGGEDELLDVRTLFPIGEEQPPPPPPENEEATFPRWEDEGEGGAQAIGATEVDDSQLLFSPSVRPSHLTGDEEEASAFEPAAPGDATAGEEAVKMGAEIADPAAEAASQGIGKRKRGRPPKAQGGGRAPPAKRKEEEEVCFICFDGGNLVVCDRRGCSKVYHPACVNRDDAFFRTRGRWNCGWHICSICERAAQYMCYTCTYSLCKVCIREANFFSVRGSKGFCETCYSTVMLIESSENGNENKVGVDFNDRNSWEYLFKEYWLYQKRKLVLTLEELKNAKNPWKGSDVSAYNEESSDDLYNANDDQEDSSESSSGYRDGSTSSRKKVRKRSRNTVDDESSAKEVGGETMSMPEYPEWASQELLEFVALMKNGDKSFLTQFDVQALLLEYIKRNNLRDPRKKSQIVCDPRLQNLFGKARVGHFEMLKLLESHFLIKEASQADADDNQAVVIDPDSGQVDAEGYSDTTAKMSLDKRRKCRKKIEGRELQTNLDDYAAIDVHNINLIYLRRNLMEDLIDDTDAFNEKIVGSFVRIRIPGTGQRQDMYRLVQVVGTQMFAEKYKIGKKTTDIALQILNLDKMEVVTIDVISNQDFTEEECKRLRQSIKCGLISRLTVGDVQKKARVLQAVRVDDWLDSEKLRLGHLRDRASETGRRKELRECVEKLHILSTPEERMRRLNEVPDIHADPHMDPDYESAEEEEVDDKKGDKYSRLRESVSRRKGRDLFPPGRGPGSNYNGSVGSKSSSNLNRGSRTEDAQDKLDAYSDGADRTNELSSNQGKDSQWTKSWGTPNTQTSATGLEAGIWNNNQLATKPGSTHGVASETSASVPSRLSVPSNVSENDKVWHYQDPAGIVQGPFSMVQLLKWNKFFPPGLRIWLTTEKQENSILLTDVLKSQNCLPQQEPQHNSYPQPANFAGPMGNRDDKYGGRRGTNNSTRVGMQNGSNWSARQNNATFSTAGNTLPNAGRWATRSANLSALEMEAVKGNNAWFGQPSGQKSPRSAAPFSGNPYQQPSYQSGEGQGYAGIWNIGQDHGSTWNSERPRGSRASGQGYERQHSSWSPLNQQSQVTSGEPWKARPANYSNLLTPTQQPSRTDWTSVQGSLHASASTASSIQPMNSGWGTTLVTGFSGAHKLPTENPDGDQNMPNQSNGEGSWSVTSASVPSMSRMADVGGAQILEIVDQFGDPPLSVQQKPTESNAPNIVVNQSALFLKKEEISSNDATVSGGSAMNKSQSFESDYPSPTPRGDGKEFSGDQPNEADPATKWPQAHDSSASVSQGSDPDPASLAFRPLDPQAHLSRKVDNMQLLSRNSDEGGADKDIISEMQNLSTQKSLSEEQNKQPPLAGMEEKLVDPASNIKPTAESDVLELTVTQRSETSSASRPVCELHGRAPASAHKQEPNGSSTVPTPPGGEPHFSGPDPIKYSNLEGAQDTTAIEWSLPSPTPGSRPSGWDIGADSSSGSSVELAILSNPGWGTKAKDVPSWGGAPQLNVGTGSAQGSENRGWATAIQGHANTGSGAPTQGNANANAGWGTLGQVCNNANTDWRTQVQGNTNANLRWEAPAWGNLTSSSLGAPIQGNSNPNTGWCAPSQGNSNQFSGWGVPPAGNGIQNLGWGALTQQGNKDAIAGWGTGSNRSWNSPARDPDSWGAQRKHHGDDYPEGRVLRHGGGRSSWNRTQSSSGGGSSRPPPRGEGPKGQGQRGVCRFHENGHCKKGASCNYLHP